MKKRNTVWKNTYIYSMNSLNAVFKKIIIITTSLTIWESMKRIYCKTLCTRKGLISKQIYIRTEKLTHHCYSKHSTPKIFSSSNNLLLSDVCASISALSQFIKRSFSATYWHSADFFRSKFFTASICSRFLVSKLRPVLPIYTASQSRLDIW